MENGYSVEKVINGVLDMIIEMKNMKDKDEIVYNKIKNIFHVVCKLYNNDYNGDITLLKKSSYKDLVHKIFYEFTILAYYMRLRKDGLIVSDKLLLNHNSLADNHKTDVAFNIKFYLSSVNVIKKVPINFKIFDSIYHPMNFSILPIDENVNMYPFLNNKNVEYITVVRYINYTIDSKTGNYYINDPKHTIRSKTYIELLDSNFMVVDAKECLDICNDTKYNDVRATGLEDGIIFLYNHELWISCVSLETNEKRRPQIVLCSLNSDLNIQRKIFIESPFDKIEKNWLPFIDNNELLFYRCGFYTPFNIYKMDISSGLLRAGKTFMYDLNLNRFKGSASPITFLDGYLILFHESNVKSGEIGTYYHRFAFLDKEFDIKMLSHPFIFSIVGIEFCRSMCYDSTDMKNILFTVSERDKDSYIYIMSVNDIQKLLYPLNYFEI